MLLSRDFGRDRSTHSHTPAAAAEDAPPRLASVVLPDQTPETAVGARDELLEAIESMRLELAGVTMGASGPVHEDISGCVATLDRVHAQLRSDRDRRRQLEAEISATRAALARARTELAGSRAGERRARRLAMHDGLTSLPNRRFFLDRLERALLHVESRRPAVALLYLDLDGFKQINDVHGHVAGDEVLRIVAERLSRAVRAEDVMSRLGGDEFACLIEELTSRDELGRLAAKLLDAVSSPVSIGASTLAVRSSIGIATYPGGGATAEALLTSADDAMYRAKRQNRGYAFSDRFVEA